MNTTDALKKAVKVAGGQAALGRLIGVKQGEVWAWLNGRPIKAVSVIPIEKATGVSRHDLRPDIYPRDDVA